MNTKLILISGPSASGKDSIVDELKLKLGSEKVEVAKYYTTRKELRPGEQKTSYFISEEEFQNKINSGEIPEYSWGLVGDYRVGYDTAEYSKAPIVLVNIDDKKARLIRDDVIGRGGDVLTIFVHAPESDRIQRFRLRGSWLFEEPARYRMETDVTDPNPENHSDFDLVVENKEGEFENTMKVITEKVKEFIQ